MVAPKFPIPLADLQKAQKEMVPKIGYKSGIGEYNPGFKEDPLLHTPKGPAPIQEALLKEVRHIIADLPGAVLIGDMTSVKTFESASGKVVREYGGENWGKFKDLNRCTVVVLRAGQMNDAWIRIKAHFNKIRSGFYFFSETVAEADKDKCGYSGYTVFVRSTGGQKGEIQINYPPMMYAKTLEEFRKTFPNGEAKMKADFPILPGGLGHKMYDLHKVHKGTKFGDDLEAASKLYYDYFRSDRDLNLGRLAVEAVRNLKQDDITILLSPAPLAGPPPVAPPSWMADSRRVWTQRRG